MSVAQEMPPADEQTAPIPRDDLNLPTSYVAPQTAIEKELADTSSSILIPFRTEGSKSPLFLVHGGLGHAFLRPEFTEVLDPDRPVYCFQARGMTGREPPHTRIEDMAEDYVWVIRDMQPHGPYVLGSFCGGSHVGIAMAGILRHRGEELHPLVLIYLPVVPPAREGRVDRRISMARFRSRASEGSGLPFESHYCTFLARMDSHGKSGPDEDA